jgi:hypothetical protein
MPSTALVLVVIGGLCTLPKAHGLCEKKPQNNSYHPFLHFTVPQCAFGDNVLISSCVSNIMTERPSKRPSHRIETTYEEDYTMDSIGTKTQVNVNPERTLESAQKKEAGQDPQVITQFETYESHSAHFSSHSKIKDFCIRNKGAIASTLVETAVGAAIGAGAIALSGGSILAAIGLSTAFSAAVGVVKGIGHAFMGSLNFGGHSGSSSALDRNPAAMALLMGGVGTAKGIARGAVLSTLMKIGFGPVGGAVAGAIMPSIEKAGWHFFDTHNGHNAYHGTR